MSRIYEQQLVKEIDQSALTLWARMVTLLESTNDRIEKLEERIKEIEESKWKNGIEKAIERKKHRNVAKSVEVRK